MRCIAMPWVAGAQGGALLARRYGPCEAGSLKERMKRAVALLGAREVDDIIAKEGKIEVRAGLLVRRVAVPPARGSVFGLADADHQQGRSSLRGACRWKTVMKLEVLGHGCQIGHPGLQRPQPAV